MTRWHPTDSQALAELLELHVPARPRILDCTYGRCRVWGHLPVRQSVIKVDINGQLPGLDLVADWRELPRHYVRGSIDCLVWDPSHVADVGRTSQFYGRYVAPQNPVKGDNMTHLYPCFLEVAGWLVKPRTGVCLLRVLGGLSTEDIALVTLLQRGLVVHNEHHLLVTTRARKTPRF